MEENINKNEFRDDIESYLKENIKILHNQLDKNEELYNEVKEIFDDQRNTGTYGNLKSVTEIAGTLSKIRSTGIDAADRLFKAKTTVLTLEQSSRKLKQDADHSSDNDIMISKFKEFLNNNTKEAMESVSVRPANIPPKESQINQLDEILEKKFNSGDIKHTNNDNLAFEKFNSSNKVTKEEVDYE